MSGLSSAVLALRTCTAPASVLLPVSVVSMDTWSGESDSAASSEDNLQQRGQH